MHPFTITNRISKADYIALILKQSYRHPIYIGITAFGVIMLIVAILKINRFISTQDTSNDLPIAQLFFVLMVLIIPLTTRRQASKNYDNTPRLHGDVIYTFSDIEINSKGENFSNSFAWNTIIKRVEIDKYILLYTGQNIAEIFLKENFSSDQLDFIRSKV